MPTHKGWACLTVCGSLATCLNSQNLIQITKLIADIFHVNVFCTWILQFSNSVDLSDLGSFARIDLKCILPIAEQHQRIVHEAFHSLGMDQEDGPCQFRIGQFCDKEEANVKVMQTCVKVEDISTISFPSISSKVTATFECALLLTPWIQSMS